MRRTPASRRAWTKASCSTSAKFGQDLLDELLGDLGQAVFLAGVPRDLLEDVLLGLAGECRGAPGHHGAARECFHLSDLLSGWYVIPQIGRTESTRSALVALCAGRVTLSI